MRPREGRFTAWDVERLVHLTKDFPRIRVSLDAIREINEADLQFPIILSSEGRAMGGIHRVLKALLNGSASIEAVRFEHDPEPDFVNVAIDELPE